MKTYTAKYEVYYNTPPQSPKINTFSFKGASDKVAENIARWRISVSIGKDQSAKLLSLSREI